MYCLENPPGGFFKANLCNNYLFYFLVFFFINCDHNKYNKWSKECENSKIWENLKKNRSAMNSSSIAFDL